MWDASYSTFRFFGKIGRNQNREIYPAYNVLAGARVHVEKPTEYAKKVSEISAKHIPDFVHDFLNVYINKKDTYNDYYEFLEKEGNELIKSLCSKYSEVPSFESDPEFYRDFGAKKRLSLDELGTAECSAGLFDMIDVDKKENEKIKKTYDSEPQDKQELLLHKSVFHSSRMLLVTRGLDPKSNDEVFKLFQKHFIQTNLIEERFNTLIETAKTNTKISTNEKTIVFELADELVNLYKNMDDSLRFKTKPAQSETQSMALVKKDFRKTPCPINFVKTKLELEQLASGQELEILIDDGEPIRNVPGSVKNEGHTIIKEEKQDDGSWKVLIKRK